MPLQFKYRSGQEWTAKSSLSLLGWKIQHVVLADDDGTHLGVQQNVLEHALEVIPKLEAECRSQLFRYYKEACDSFSDVVGTTFLPEIEGEDELARVFEFVVLEIPEQIPEKGMTFRLVGGCTWNDEDGVQMFFRDSALEKVDSGAAFHF